MQKAVWVDLTSADAQGEHLHLQDWQLAWSQNIYKNNQHQITTEYIILILWLL